MSSDFIALQAKIRQDAQEQSDVLTGLSRWAAEGKSNGSRKSGVSLASGYSYYNPSNTGSQSEVASTRKPAEHVYDKGYRKWEHFDADAALNEVDGEHQPAPMSSSPSTTATTNATTPSVGIRAPKVVTVTAGSSGPLRHVAESTAAREEGNELYRRGRFAEAIDRFTVAISLNPQSAAAYSNRSMSHMQLKEYRRAIDDATQALKLDPCHVKSWLRRSVARSAIGCHAAAMRDASVALSLEPSNKQAMTDVRKEMETMKACTKKAPHVELPTQSMAPTEPLEWISPDFISVASTHVRLDELQGAT